MQNILYAIFTAQVIMLSTLGIAAAQSEDENKGFQLNATNATSSPEDIKKMEVIGGNVNQTLNV